MRTKNIIITLAALALCGLASSCVKEKDYSSYTETTDSRFGTVEEQVEYLNGVLVTVGEEQVELDAYLKKLEESSNAHTAEVEVLIKELDGRVKAVRDSLPNYAKMSDMEATFATLATVDSLSTVLAALEVKVKSDSTALTQSLKDKIDATHAAVTEKFKSYYKKTELDALIKAQNGRMDTLAMDIDSAKTDIKTLKENIATLEKNHAEISAKLDEEMKILKVTDTGIEEELKKLDAVTTEKFAALGEKVTANTQAIAALEARVKKLENRIQSIEVVPDYADGSVEMANKDSVAIRFEVRPRYLIDSLAGKDSLFSFQIIKTTAATKAGIFTNIDVQSVTKSAEDSLLIVTVDGTKIPGDFFDTTATHQCYSARLVLSDHNTDRTSAYFPLMPARPEKVIWEGSSVIREWTSGDAMRDLSWGQYDWSTVSVGTELKITYILNPDGDYHQIRAANGSWEVLPSWKKLGGGLDVVIVDKDGSLSIVLAADDMEQLVDQGGLVVCGAYFIVKKVSLL